MSIEVSGHDDDVLGRLLIALDADDPESELGSVMREGRATGQSREDLLSALNAVWDEDPAVVDHVIERLQLGEYDADPPSRRAKT